MFLNLQKRRQPKLKHFDVKKKRFEELKNKKIKLAKSN